MELFNCVAAVVAIDIVAGVVEVALFSCVAPEVVVENAVGAIEIANNFSSVCLA